MYHRMTDWVLIRGMGVCSPVLATSVPLVPQEMERTCPATRLWDVPSGVWDLRSGLSGAGQNRHREEDVSKLSEKGEKKKKAGIAADGTLSHRARRALDSSTRPPADLAPSRPRQALI